VSQLQQNSWRILARRERAARDARRLGSEVEVWEAVELRRSRQKLRQLQIGEKFVGRHRRTSHARARCFVVTFWRKAAHFRTFGD